jgi:LysM repeat protein
MLTTGLVLVLLLAAIWHPTPAAAQSGPAHEIIRLVNELRASLGLPAFQVNAALMAAAQGHAEWMAANVTYTHTGAGGSRPQDRANAAGYVGYVSENIVGGTGMTPEGGVNWWRNSDIHYRTMTSTHYSECGAGYATGSGHNMYVLVVGQPSNAPPPSNNQPPPAQNPIAPAAEPVVVVPVEISPPREDGSIVHVVQSGQTAWDIAAVYGVDLVTLLELNNLPDNPILLPGDEIVVRPPERPANPDEPLMHTVRLGDTAWSIAARYHVPLDELLTINGLSDNPLLQPGDELIVRLAAGQTPPPTRTPPPTHTVQSGDTAWSIAARYGLTVEELLALNHLGPDSILYPGDELIVRRPDSTATSTPSPTGGTTAAPTGGATAVPATATATRPASAAVMLPSPAIRIATVTPTPTPILSPAPPAAPAGGVENTLVTVGLAVGIGLAALAIGVAVVGNILERRH